MPLPIIGPFNVTRFVQSCPEDAANFFIAKIKNGKRQYNLWPTLGRSHIKYNGINRLNFAIEPRGLFKSIRYEYIVTGSTIYRNDEDYNVINISGNKVVTDAGNMFFTYLVVNSIVFACFVDSQKVYVYIESGPQAGQFFVVTDPNAPGNSTVNGVLTKPGYIIAFGNRIAVSVANSAQFFLSQINLLTPNNGADQQAMFQPAYCFTPGTILNYVPPAPIVVAVTGASVFAQEDGIIGQMAVLNNTLYIFCDFVTGVWSNSPAVFSGTNAYFPWKKNSTYNWNFGIADPLSLDVDFGFLVFLAQNSDGLLQVMSSNGGQPEKISDDSVDVLFQNYVNKFGSNSPFLSGNACGFLYQYENKIFYRVSGGPYTGTGLLDQTQGANSIEYKFDTQSWHRCTELNGERSRVQRHVFFNNIHMVTLIGDSTIYDMSGQYYYNEIRNPAQPDVQAEDAYLQYPFRYERVTPIISDEDYSEFETNYVEIDFVFGDSNINFSENPFPNTKFIIDEEVDSVTGETQYLIDEMPGVDGEPVFMITDDSNFPVVNDVVYNALYKPNVFLYWSDDGGISFHPADNREFSQLGVYQWRMRWYQLGISRNRVYKLVAVSPVPIVILGGVMNVRRASGGAN